MFLYCGDMYWESLWHIQDRPGIFIVYDPPHANFSWGTLGKGDLFRDLEENSVSVNR